MRVPNILSVTNDSKLFADIDASKQVDLQNMKIIVNVVETGTREDLAELFDAINTGMVLNAQEKRNALDSDWARWVRHLSRLNSDLLVKIFGPDYKRRLKGDEFLVEAICFSKMTSNESTGVSQTIKNSLYVSDIDDIDTGLYEEKFVLLNQYISEVDDNLIYGSSVMNLFWALFNGIKILVT